MGRLDDALREYQSTVKDFAQDVVARNGLAEILKRTGCLGDALREYQSTVKDFPQNVVARNGLAEVLKTMGRLDDALREYQSTVKDFPHDIVARNGAASVCVLMSDYEAAREWIGSSTESAPMNWVGLHILGMIHLRTGRLPEAVALFERGVRDGPFENRCFSRSALAYTRLLARQPDRAAEALQDDPSVVSRVLQMHIYGELHAEDKVRQAYDQVRSNRNPRVIELTAELVSRARLTSHSPAHPDQWVFDREFELLLAA